MPEIHVQSKIKALNTKAKKPLLCKSKRILLDGFSVRISNSGKYKQNKKKIIPF